MVGKKKINFEKKSFDPDFHIQERQRIGDRKKPKSSNNE